MFKSKFAFNLYVLHNASKCKFLKKNVKTDINSITDFQNMPEYTNNTEPGLCVFESDIFIN